MLKNRGALFVLGLVSITAILFYLSKPYSGFISDYPLLSVSQLLALVGVTLVSVNFLISTRSRLLTRLYGGFDIMFHHHHRLGALSLVFLLCHPLFLFLNALPQMSLAVKYIFYSDVLAYNLGLTALLTLILTLIFTFIVKLPYHIWLMTHRFLGVFLVFASLHIFLVGSDIANFLPLKIWIFSLLFLSLLSVLYRRFFYHLFTKTYFYKIVRIKITGDIFDLYLEPEKEKIPFFPGQFAFVTFKIPHQSSSVLPFSFASSPSNPTLRFAIRALGDHTLAITSKIKKGIKVQLDGPYGLFAEDIPVRNKIVFISGGIGITPFLSLLEQAQINQTRAEIHLYSSFKNHQEAFCHNDLASLAKDQSWFTYHSLFTDTMPHLTAKQIQSDLPDIRNYSFYLCGPISMMISLRDQLMALGVHQTHIHFENFSFK